MKTGCVLALFVLMAFSSYAQKRYVHLHGGPKVGLNVVIPDYNLQFTDELTEALRSGYAGVFVELGLGKNLAVQSEGLVEQFGFQWKYGEYHPHIIEKVSYFNIPVILKCKFGGFSVYGGYQWGILNFAERKMKDPKYDSPYGIDSEMSMYEFSWHSANDMYAKSTKSVLVGIEYNSPFGFGCSLRYVRGLTDITVAGFDSIYSEGDYLYNTYISTGLHWSFGAKRR